MNPIQNKRPSLIDWAQNAEIEQPIPVTVAELDSNADVTLYAVGTGNGGPKQETPTYMLKHAKEHPNQSIELIHCDPCFKHHMASWASNPDDTRAALQNIVKLAHSCTI